MRTAAADAPSPMQIRCSQCTKTVAIGPGGELPAACSHCGGSPGPGTLGPYDAVRLIAAGGMGEVYLARHRELGTEVALKVLPSMPLDTIPGVRERFAREARLTARIRHPGVVKIHGNDVAGDRPYLVLEFVAGRTLRERLRDGPLDVAEAARITAATAAIVAAAHAEGVLHRDIKPDNVMVAPNGDVRVLDFGIARAVQDDAPLTRTGEIVGTPEYMAPEQLLDGPESTTERTDVHALGVLLYELLTGRSPFRGANLFQALKLVESFVPPLPASQRADVPPELDAVVQRALHKDPADRFASARDFQRAVEAAVPGAAASADAPRPSWGRTAGIVAAGALAAALLLVAAFRMFLMPSLTALTTAGGDVTAAAKAVKDRHELRQLLTEGRWWRAAVDARAAMAAGDPSAKTVAQDAFLLSHLAWPLAAGAPAWLGRCDERERRRLFGDTGEAPAEASHDPRFLLATGDAAGAADALYELSRADTHLDRESRRLLTLAEQLAGRPLSSPDWDDALTRLLTGETPRIYAARLPIDEPEHWLARRCQVIGTNDEGTVSAAEGAWLRGAGELAVLLDASLTVIAERAVRDLWPVRAPGLRGSLPANAAAQRRRLEAADRDDAPASHLFAAMLDTMQGTQPDLTVAREFPAAARVAAASWFVATAAATPEHRDGLLRIAVVLGASPDWSLSPWSDTAPAARGELDAEAARGR